MIALSREHDVQEVLALASSGEAIVRVQSLVDRLGWVEDRLEDALADAEESGDLQSMESPDGDLVVVLSPLGAEKLGVKLDHRSRWIPRDQEERTFRFVHSRSENDIHEDEGKLSNVASKDVPPWLETHFFEAVNDRFRFRKLIFVGSTPWPMKNTKIVEIQTDDGPVRDLAVTSRHCPACGRAKPRTTKLKANCVVCERFRSAESPESEGSNPKQAKVSRKPTSFIRFKPRSRGAQKLQEV